jgi:hypothetical protein
MIYAGPNVAAIGPDVGLGQTRRVERLSRAELYELIWSSPVSTVSVKYGISDVGLAKACKRANIPLPERGYWAKLAAGQTVQRTPLEAANSPVQEEIVLRPRRRSKLLRTAPHQGAGPGA